MKKIIYLSITLSAFLFSCSSSEEKKPTVEEPVVEKTEENTTEKNIFETKNQCVISGTTDGQEGDVVTLEQAVANSKNVIEAVRLDKDGKFRFEKGIERNGFFRVNFKDQAYAYLVTDTSDLQLEFSLADKDVKVLNSVESSLYQQYLKMMTDFKSKAQVLTSAAMEINLKRDSLISFQKHYRQNMKAFVLKNSPSIVALNASKEFSQKASEHTEFFDEIKKIYKNEAYAQEFLAFLEQQLSKVSIEVGSIAPDFELKTPEGNLLKLSSLRGQYVLIDFWASWCGPCRRENPNVVKMYNKYHNKGFEILGVSLDNNQGNWEKAIKKDGLTWKHVSDLKQWDSKVVPLYGVTGIPMTVLLDKEGRIIARDLRGASLEAKLAELIK